MTPARSISRTLAAVLVLLVGSLGEALADDVGVTPTKLVITNSAPRFRGVFVVRDTSGAVHKGTGTDVSTISARLNVSWDSTSGAFLMPIGANDGIRGWVVNTDRAAKYLNRDAGFSSGDNVKVGVIKPGSLLKVTFRGFGDGPLLDVYDAPDGSVRVCLTIVNGGDQHRIGATWPPGTCVYSEQLGGSGRKLLCRGGGLPDAACSASP